MGGVDRVKRATQPLPPQGVPSLATNTTQGNSVSLYGDECVRMGRVCARHSCRMVREVNSCESQDLRVKAKVRWRCVLSSSNFKNLEISQGEGDNGAYPSVLHRMNTGGQHANTQVPVTSLARKRLRK